jgi:hypothetical protein
MVDVYQQVRKAYSSALKMEAAHFSEMLVNIYQSTQHHTPEEAIFICHENIKSFLPLLEIALFFIY